VAENGKANLGQKYFGHRMKCAANRANRTNLDPASSVSRISSKSIRNGISRTRHATAFIGPPGRNPPRSSAQTVTFLRYLVAPLHGEPHHSQALATRPLSSANMTS
jgi:hypothetical protein